MEGKSAFAPFFASTWLHSLRYAEVSLEKTVNGGEAGIRTLGRLQTFAGFQDQCFRPLSHLTKEAGNYSDATPGRKI